MEKLIYITDIDKSKEIGVYNKIISQCNVFNNYYETILICQENNSMCIENITYENIKHIDDFFYTTEEGINRFSKVKEYRRLNKINSFVFDFIKKSRPGAIYVRKYNFFSKGFNYLKYAKNTLKCKVICEIPTYPYKEECFSKKKYLSYFISKFFDYRLEKIADKITVVLGQDIKMKSNKFMPIRNGIDAYKIKPKEKNLTEDNLNLIGAAHLSFWHGYDRIIKGLKNYYDSENDIKTALYFHIAGDGPELSGLKQLAEDYKLNDYVIFHGSKTGQELDDLFDGCSIGIGSLGLHRAGLTCGCTLKAREYCARGIPFLIAARDEGFKDGFKYILRIKPDESPVNINQIIEFYNSIKNENYIEEMRNYAEINLTWAAVMKPVMDVIYDKK